jgi:hypothetical protein
MSYAREDALHRQILNKERALKKVQAENKYLKIIIKDLKAKLRDLKKVDKRYNTLFMTYIKVCERNVDYEDLVTDLYNEILTLRQTVDKNKKNTRK